MAPKRSEGAVIVKVLVKVLRIFQNRLENAFKVVLTAMLPVAKKDVPKGQKKSELNQKFVSTAFDLTGRN